MSEKKVDVLCVIGCGVFMYLGGILVGGGTAWGFAFCILGGFLGGTMIGRLLNRG